MLHGNKIGWLGYLHPRLVKTCDIGAEVLAFEMDLAAVTERAIPLASELSRFPSVRRDLALVVPESMPWAALEASLKRALGPLLREVLLFDRYVGTGLEPGSKSLAMGLILQDVSRTLTDLESESVVQKALLALAEDCGAHHLARCVWCHRIGVRSSAVAARPGVTQAVHGPLFYQDAAGAVAA